MADLEKLKNVRSRAQAAFTKRGNALTKPGLLEPLEILNEWKLFKADFTRVTDTGYEYAEALREVGDEESKTSAVLIDAKTAECEGRYLEVKTATQEIFWKRHAEQAFGTQTKTAESAIASAEEEEQDPLKAMKDRRLRNRGLDREVAELSDMLNDWKDLIPGTKALDLNTRYKSLKKRVLALEDKLEADEEEAQAQQKLDSGTKADIASDCREGDKSKAALDSLAIPGTAPNGKQRKPWGISLVHLVKPQRFSSLSKLCGIVAWTRRAAEAWLKVHQTPEFSKWEGDHATLSVEERRQAFHDLVLAAQSASQFSDSTLNRLVVHQDKKTGLLLCGGRIQSWTEDGAAVPLLPYNSWIATLLSREAHKNNHEGIAATLLRTRKKAWIVQGRKIVKKVVNDCIPCRKLRGKMCQQVMSDLPPERSQSFNPFEYSTLDLFGPFEIKDSVKRRTGKKVWGIVFCCMASRAVHVDLVDDQSSESFLQAYSRFVALRGHPRKLWSDKGTNFIGAKPALHDLHNHLAALKNSSIEDKAGRNGTEWA
ncbi:hypothetical protein ACEWY4_018389 [Coilia grayii]|uniref:Integrase zinc-binding domain-containing protein n=1 Tax=Coilia grayii TaxID=363190 RepID=A0ABD1JLT8_9TELE